MTVTNMKRQILLLIFSLLIGLSALAESTNDFPNEGNKDDPKWRIGGKIHFEEESGPDYIGIKDINKIVRIALKKTVPIDNDVCTENAKILLKKDGNEIQITHFEEKSRPGIGEEMHATLLYTQSRGFCSSETLKQVCESLFERCDFPPTIENVATKYSAIIKPEWKFKISEVILTKSPSGTSFIIAILLYEDHERIFKDNKPISAGLHMTLVTFDEPILAFNEITDPLINEINLAIKDRIIKIANKNGVADLEFGISGSSWRLRAGERIQWP